jgi:hypothetical protein
MSVATYEQWFDLLNGSTPAMRRVGRPDYGTTSGGGGPPPPTDPDRAALVYGTYEPDLSVVGVIPGTVLTDYNSPSTATQVIPSGTALTNKRVYGDLIFRGPATFNNCYLYGGALEANDDRAVLWCNSKSGIRSGPVVCTDCTIAPQNESNARNCTIGWQYELYRCYLKGGIDGIGIYQNTSGQVNADVVVKGCLVEDLAFYCSPTSDGTDTNPGDPIGPHKDGTHSDVIQVQSGKNITVVGNSLRGTSHKIDGSRDMWGKEWMTSAGWTSGAVILLQTQSGLPTLDSSCVVTDNYIYGGGAGSQINIKTTANGVVYKNNRHYRATPVGPGWGGYWIRFQNMATTTLSGINGSPTNTNMWIDGPYAGTAMVTPRDHGVEVTG